MDVCPRCARPHESPLDRLHEASATTTWQDAARVGNVAEAGYLASQLVERGIAARVLEMPGFDSLHGDGQATYLLQVDQRQVQAAVEFLSEEAERDGEEDEYEARYAAESLPRMRSLGYVALASLAGFWAGSHTTAVSPPHHGPAAHLASELATATEPLVARDGRGRTTHRLRYDRPRAALVLDVDRTGDGRWDRTHLYPLDALGVR